jgi:hypothetical protein
VADQSGLNQRERLENLVGALAVAPGGARVLCGGSVVLVDDLITTGASLAEAARAVRVAVAQERAAAGARQGDRAAAATAREEAVRVTTGERAAEATAMATGDATVTGIATATRNPAASTGARRAGAFAWTDRAEGARAVYGGVTREGRGVRPSGAREGGARGVPAGPAGVGHAGDVVCAAVVAAPPDAFEINRNCRRS